MKKTNNTMKDIIIVLEKAKKPIWKRIAQELKASTRRRASVNVTKIEKNTKENDTVVIPGKVLGDGELTHKVTVAALGFSKSAAEKLKDNAISIKTLVEKNPKGTGVKILK